MSGTLTSLGTILEKDEPRDAIHIAVMCCTAGETLRPGADVGQVDGVFVTGYGVADKPKCTIGIVDPFLRRPVMKGQKFWLFLYPNTITSLRHDWTHPEIDRG